MNFVALPQLLVDFSLLRTSIHVVKGISIDHHVGPSGRDSKSDFLINSSLLDQNAGDKGGVPHWQWEAVGDDNLTYFMLNTDFEIFFDLDLDANGKAACAIDVTCADKGTCGKHGACPKASTYELGKNYIDVSNVVTDIIIMGL